MKLSLIFTVYKRADFLEKVLASARLLDPQPNEIIIAEDGNDASIAKVVEKYRPHLPIHHLTQEDLGNRKPLIMNKALAHSSGEYLIFVDGDCILRSDFVGAHLELASEDSFLTGRRVDLSPKASEHLSEERIASGYLNRLPLFLYADSIWGETRRFGRMFRTPKFLRELLGQNKILDIRGCNFSVHRKHLLSINGFSNDFSGAYGEDSDAEYRLKFLGLKMRSVKGAAIQFHLWHPEQSKDPLNQELLRNVLRNKEAVCRNGLNQIT